jgi:hypothetical protein
LLVEEPGGLVREGEDASVRAEKKTVGKKLRK